MDNAPRGTLYRKNGYYYARIYYYADGRRKSKDKATGIAIESSSARKAKQQERAANQELERFMQSFTASMTGQPRRPQQQTVAETVKIWLDHISGTKAPGTLAGYTYIANDITLYFTDVAPAQTAELTTSQVEAYLAWERMRRQPEYAGTYKVPALYADGSGIENTVHHRYTVLRAVLQHAKREGIVTRNVASKRDCQIDVPKPQRQEFAVLNVDEARKLLHELDHEPLWFRAAVMFGLLLGLRRSEVIGLRTSDLDWENHILTVRRSATQQTIGGRNTVTIKPYTKNRHESIRTLFRSEGEKFCYTPGEIERLVCSLNYKRLYSVLCDTAEPVYVCCAGGGICDSHQYHSTKLFPANATLIWSDEGEPLGDDNLSTSYSNELWLLEDMTIAAVSCFRVLNSAASYITEYREYKGDEWPAHLVPVNILELWQSLIDKYQDCGDEELDAALKAIIYEP